MNIVAMDFETYFDDEYRVEKMTTEAYVRDPRFEVHGVGILDDKGGVWIAADSDWNTHDELSSVDWKNTAVLCHHAAFDGLILSHHYGAKPAYWLDTYSMAQYLFGATASKSLEALAQRFGLHAKTVPYEIMKGRRWASFSPQERRAIAEGCLRDCEITRAIFNKMLKGDY
jgi:hypothetical protein